jgi:hypothetical protein
MDNYFLPIPSPFEVGVDLNMDNGHVWMGVLVLV